MLSRGLRSSLTLKRVRNVNSLTRASRWTARAFATSTDEAWDKVMSATQGDDLEKAQIMALRSQIANARGLVSGTKQDTEVDFSSYGDSIRGEGVVSELQSAFTQAVNSCQVPDVDANQQASLTAKKEEILQAAADFETECLNQVAEIDAKLEDLESNMVGEDTTIDEMLDQNPGMAEEIQQEVDDWEWGKDTGATA
eukprot:g135.t1